MEGVNAEIWIQIDTQKLQLNIKKDNKTIKTLKNIAIGQGGAGQKLKRGDNITPIGIIELPGLTIKVLFTVFLVLIIHR